MSRDRITLYLAGAYLWIVMILLGGLAVETFMIYPNIFADPPQSTEAAARFFAVSSPKLYFRPMGAACWVLGAATVISAWRLRPARWWLLGSVAAIAADGVWSQLFSWPRNTVMFEGLARHSAETIVRTAHEFQDLHWPRVAFNVIAAVLAFVGFLHCYRQHHDGASHPARRRVGAA
jgi:hypothetical protein